MGVSLKTIAEALELSKTTISWILSGKGEEKGFSESTIKLVKDYAKKVGYEPNLLARSLSIGVTHTIGLIIPAVGDTFYSQMTQAVEARTQKYGYSLIVSSSEGNSAKEAKLINILRRQQVDGLIIAPTKKINIGIKKMISESFPFVFIDRYFPSLDTNYVIVDNDTSSEKLVSLLIGEGARKIAVVTTDMDLLVMNKRVVGYRAALENAGIGNDDALYVEVHRDSYKQNLKQQLDLLFEHHPDVDGFFFTTHYLALESIRYFLEHDIDYNRMFHMGCIHTTIALDILAPKMKVAMMPIDELGAAAVDVLIEQIKCGDGFESRQQVFSNLIPK